MIVFGKYALIKGKGSLKLKVILAKNDYPKAIIEKETEIFVKNRTKIRTTAPQTETNKKAVKYLVLPFVNNKVIEYGKRLRNFIESNFADLELKVVFAEDTKSI